MGHSLSHEVELQLDSHLLAHTGPALSLTAPGSGHIWTVLQGEAHMPRRLNAGPKRDGGRNQCDFPVRKGTQGCSRTKS